MFLQNSLIDHAQVSVLEEEKHVHVESIVIFIWEGLEWVIARGTEVGARSSQASKEEQDEDLKTRKLNEIFPLSGVIVLALHDWGLIGCDHRRLVTPFQGRRELALMRSHSRSHSQKRD